MHGEGRKELEPLLGELERMDSCGVSLCSGPRAYAGLTSSYYERVTENFFRLDDPAWELVVRAEPEVPWTADLTPR